MFAPVLTPGAYLFTTDDTPGTLIATKVLAPQCFLGAWSDGPLMGIPVGRIPVAWTGLLLAMAPLRFFVNWVHGMGLFFASLALGGFLRTRGFSWWSCLLGAVAAFWLGTNLTLTYAGHIPKFAVLMFMGISLFCLGKASGHRPVAWGLLAGVAMGFMLIEQQDVGLFCAMFVGAYAAFIHIRRAGWGKVRKWLPVLAGTAGVALLTAAPTLLSSYVANVQGAANVQDEDPQAKWEFVTQWSQPPGESVDFIAPGYMGWRSGEPDGPYWGVCGQSAGWDRTHQGFMNFRLESVYVGAIPIVFALFAVVAAILCPRSQKSEVRSQKSEGGGQKPLVIGQESLVIGRKSEVGAQKSEVGGQTLDLGDSDASASTLHPPPSTILSDHRAEILFWGIAALVALLLAFGKFLPLYKLFYQLPVVNAIRCPNKFLQPFQVMLGILAAYGFDIMTRRCWRPARGE